MQSQRPETTENEHIKLLEKIRTLESNEPTDANISRALHDLKLRYNEWIEASNQRAQYPNYIEYFPTEIWTQVFLRIVEDDWANILPLMQVCQHWTSMIVSEPRLWTSIYIRSDVESLELVHSGLHLSKSLPLYVTVEVPVDSNIQRSFLQKETSRIQHLQLKPLSEYFSQLNNDRLIKVSANVLKDLGPLPSLHSLTVDIYPTTDDNNWSPILINLDAPQIRYVESAVFPQDVLETSRYTRLRHLGTSSALEIVLPELIKFSDLRRLSLFAPKVDESRSSSESPIAAYRNIAFLKSLEYIQAYSDSIWPLLRQMSSSLRVLELEITWEQLLQLFIVVQGAHYLRDLSLYIPLSSTKGDLYANRWKAPALLQVERFVLEITEQAVGPQTLSALEFANAAHLVLEALDNSLPHVRTLHLKSDIYTNDLVRLVRTMGNLSSLHIVFIVRSNRADKGTCPTLKTLRTEDQNVLRCLSMPNLTSITLVYGSALKRVENEPFDRSFASTVQSISLHSEDASAIFADGGEFTQLRMLEWYSCRYGYQYQDGSFPCLTKIIFGDVHQGVNAFCESLLRYPRLCPRLETIRSKEYPEWDMLLYMLLRRNVHHAQNSISRITRIEIAGFPAPCILVPLRDLLLGKFPLMMPSLEELSFVGIEDIYFDPTMYVSQLHIYRSLLTGTLIKLDPDVVLVSTSGSHATTPSLYRISIHAHMVFWSTT
jgi:hypothetical protein